MDRVMLVVGFKPDDSEVDDLSACSLLPP